MIDKDLELSKDATQEGDKRRGVVVPKNQDPKNEILMPKTLENKTSWENMPQRRKIQLAIQDSYLTGHVPVTN